MLKRPIALAAGLAAGLVGAQLPEFSQQYRQRLGGAMDELAAVVARFDQSAAAEGVTRDGALQRLSGNADGIARRQAGDVQQTVARLDRLRTQAAAMGNEPFGRIVGMLANLDPGIATAAWRDFEPAIPTSAEGLVTAGGGFLAGYGLIGAAGALRRRRQVAAA